MTTSHDSMTQQLTATLHGSLSQLPTEVSAAFAADRDRLDAAGTPAGVAAVGTAVADVELLTAQGATTHLHAELSGRPAVVVFYRGAWCPYCNVALVAYQWELVPALIERGATLIAVSPQKPDGSLDAQESNELTFTVLSDPGNTLAGNLGIIAPNNPDAIAAQKQLGLDVTEHNADGSADLPFPTVVVLDAAGAISFIDVHPNYTTRTESADIIAAVDALGWSPM